MGWTGRETNVQPVKFKLFCKKLKTFHWKRDCSLDFFQKMWDTFTCKKDFIYDKF